MAEILIEMASREGQHEIAEAFKAIKDPVIDAAVRAENAATQAETAQGNAENFKDAAGASANAAAASAQAADTTATALTNFLETKETLTAPAVDPTLSVSGAAADAKATGRKIYFGGKFATDYFNESELINGAIWNGQTHIVDGWTHTPLIPCEIGDKIYLAQTNGTNLEYGSYYDKDGSWLFDRKDTTHGTARGSFEGYVSSAHAAKQPAYVSINILPASAFPYANQYVIIQKQGSMRDDFIGVPHPGKVINQYTDDIDLNSLTNGAIHYVRKTLPNAPEKFFDYYIVAQTLAGIQSAGGGTYEMAVSGKGVIATRANDGGVSPLQKWTPWGYCPMVYYANPSNFIEVMFRAVQKENVTVIFEPGTYNLFDDTYNEAFWISQRAATRYTGFVLDKGVRLIANGKVVFNAIYTGTSEDIKENFSVFCIAGSCEVHGIVVNAQNIGYIVHDDAPILNPNAGITEVFDHCEFNHLGSDHTFQFSAPIPFGCGTTAGGTIVTIQNCILTTNYQNTCYSVHASTGGYGRYVLKDNVMNGKVRFRQYGDGTGTITAVSTNNKYKGIMFNGDAGITIHEYNNVVID